MPQSYKVTAAPPPVPPLPTRTPVHQDVHIPETRNCRKQISCSWLFCSLAGVLSLAFVLCVAFVPSTGIFPVHVELQAFSVPLHQQGHLQVYPPLVDEVAVKSLLIRNIYSIVINESTVPDVIVPSLSNILKEYENLSPQRYVQCWLENPTVDKPCYFDKGWLGDSCTESNKFGYEPSGETVSPCVLFRIEDSGDWKPTVFSQEEVDKSWSADYDPWFFGVACVPANSSESKKLKGIRPIPRKGFSILFFPESRFASDVYRRPFVMVQVSGLAKGTSVALDCWIRARNAFMLEDSGKVRITFTY